MSNPSNCKEYCHSYLKKKKAKSVVIEHPKSSHKFSKTIRQTGKISQGGSGKSSNS